MSRPFVDKLSVLTGDCNYLIGRSSVDNVGCIIRHKFDEPFMSHLKNENSKG
jgi:hypothetical protein